jgi:pimeloyl-ACP methyl ester carboxylesterase
MTSTTDDTRTQLATSADGTRIAYEVHGSGPVLVLVDGALCDRGMGPSADLSAELRASFAVVSYDRRGRGESGPGSTPYAVEREVEDLVAVIEANGGRAHVLGVSSGAVLALEAARRGAPVDRLVCYEAPFVLDGSHPATDPGLTGDMQQLVDQGRRGAAVSAFLRLVGVPAPFRLLMRVLPVWRKVTLIAHTLPYDLAMVVPFQQGRPLPGGHYAGVRQPVLVVAGGKSPEHMRTAASALGAALPCGTVETLPGQTHMVKAKVLGPVAAEHLLG